MRRCLLALLAWAGFSCQNGAEIRQRSDFTADWRFALDADGDFSDPDFDDSAWRELNLPHDWSIEGDFSPDHPATPGGGALPGGVGWYRKRFTVPESDRDKRFFVDFDGIYQKSRVWLNGHLLGYRPNGYVSFRYDLTPYLNYGAEENVLVVRVDNSEQPNSRWYSGSGIYRNVWLVRTHPVHVGLWGTFITTPAVGPDEAAVAVRTTLCNDSADPVAVELETALYDPEGNRVGECRTGRVGIPAASDTSVLQEVKVPDPELWSVDAPSLYRAVSTVRIGGRTVDRYETSFGIRFMRFDADQGFFLNGEPLKILGVCLHHDLGCLGTAINRRALERQLEILKEMGCNAIRTSHNPPAPELLELCDRMGFLVQDEAFDMWRKRKSEYDYSRDFPEWYERDLTDHILRDRNHPSVFMWSIGNEVYEQFDDVRADTLTLQQANVLLNVPRTARAAGGTDSAFNINSWIAVQLARIVKSLDTTRAVTSGNNFADPSNNLFRSGAMDVYGFNYNLGVYRDFQKNFPGKCFIASEATSAFATRGHYIMPSDRRHAWPETWDQAFDRPVHACSSYDNNCALWGSTHEENWRVVKDLPCCAGVFVWTGFDYLGEPTPFWWPSRSSYFGIVDLAGFPKDAYYMYQSEWSDRTVLHLFPHWNWTPGEPVDVWAYYNRADEVELFLNERSLGVKSKEPGQFHVWWRVPFEPGILRAVSRKDGKVVLTREIRTAGAPAQIRLSADRERIAADGKDLSFVTVEIVDREGTLVPDADTQLRFRVEGCGFIAGVDNGSQTSMEPFKASQRRAFHGKALVVLQNDGRKGTVRLTAEADGMPPSTLSVRSCSEP